MKTISEAILNRKTNSTDELKNASLEPFIKQTNPNMGTIEDGFLNLEDGVLIINVDKYITKSRTPVIGFIDYEGIIKKFHIKEIRVEGNTDKYFTLDANEADVSGVTLINNTNKIITLMFFREFPDQLIGNIKTVDNYAYKLESGGIQRNREYKIKDYYYPIFAETSEFGKIGMNIDDILLNISKNISIPEKKLFYITVPKGWLFFIKGISNKNELKNYYEDVNKPLEYNKFNQLPSKNVWWWFKKD